MSKNRLPKRQNLNSVYGHIQKPRVGQILFFRPNRRIILTTIKNGGGDRDRTYDLLRARQALSQLSYTPKNGFSGSHFKKKVVGLDRFELSTSRLSGVRSNRTELQALSDF